MHRTGVGEAAAGKTKKVTGRLYDRVTFRRVSKATLRPHANQPTAGAACFIKQCAVVPAHHHARRSEVAVLGAGGWYRMATTEKEGAGQKRKREDTPPAAQDDDRWNPMSEKAIKSAVDYLEVGNMARNAAL